jgi:chemotaxis protein MotB
MAIEEDPPAGVPEWVLTFGDMMSLLLTFFIMLAGMSEIKKNDKFQGVADAIEQQFGHDQSPESLTPGEDTPRRTEMADLTAAGRARRKQIVDGGVKAPSTKGEHQQVQMLRPSEFTGVGTVIPFDEFAVELTPEMKTTLKREMEIMHGKPQKIEIRGHASPRPFKDDRFRDHWDIAYERARAVAHYLTDDLQIDKRRLRVTSSAALEPVAEGLGVDSAKKNARVEVFLTPEIVKEIPGISEENSNPNLSP